MTADWTLFHTLARRVRVVEHFKLDTTVINDLYLNNPQPLPLFPNIRLLHWWADVELSLAMMSTTLHQFCISFEHGEPARPTLPCFLAQVATLTPNLTPVEITLNEQLDMTLWKRYMR